MSSDLQQAFDRVGSSPPPSTVDLAEAVRQGRQARIRRRRAAGGAVVGVGAALAASVVLVGGATSPAPGGTGRAVLGSGADGAASPVPVSGSSGAPAPAPAPSMSVAPSAGPTSSGIERKPQPPAAIADRLARVTLPDPAPGFPVRRWVDAVAGESFTSGDNLPTWTKLFGLAVSPATTATYADGVVVDDPTGPEVTLRVGLFAPAVEDAGRIKGDPVVATVQVAGTEGRVTTSTDKGTPIRTLYLHVHDVSVEIIGFDGVTTAQLVALGDALRGL